MCSFWVKRIESEEKMKWIYGKQDFKTLKRGQENCYLMTNGMGGFSSLTMIGSAARNDHCLLMACTKAPNHRYNLVHRIKEEIKTGGGLLAVSSQEFKDQPDETGFLYLSSFTYEDTPMWVFHVDGIEVRKEIGMKEGKNAVAVRYEIENRGKESVQFLVTPYFQFAPKGEAMQGSPKFYLPDHCIKGGGLELFLRTNGSVSQIKTVKETYYYRYDACDGRKETGSAQADHRIAATIDKGCTSVLEIIYEMEPSLESAQEIINGVKQRRKELEVCAGFHSEPAKTLAKSAGQFVSERASTKGSTILAGFPFFEDWGRDTMIALPGICIATRQYETAKRILRTFALNEKDGLMPNLFPEGKNEPLYNTVDAALLFINCVYLYYEAAKDMDFVLELYPVMERIINGYMEGTKFGICMEDEGLIKAGEGLDQLTWMDVRIDDILPTKRHGKPVEINAYWYNALCIMEWFSRLLNKKGDLYKDLAVRVKQAFEEQFWLEDKGYLKDLVSGTKADTQIRCNQIWAVSMPFTMLSLEKEKKIVETVFEKLYTPYGLRTLNQEDEEFQPVYEGSMKERDMAYHQGTVWTFPLGAYYLSYLKVHEYKGAAKEKIKSQMEVLECAMREGCTGQLPEIYDGLHPASSKGCFAQAWSVGEILRVYGVLEKI